MTRPAWDQSALTARREHLALPMVPLRRTDSPLSHTRWPDPMSWRSAHLVGVGPDGDALAVAPSVGSPGRVLAVRDDGTATVLDGALAASFVQPLPQGRTLLVGARSDHGVPNAQVWDADGNLLVSAFVGDAVEHVLTTPDGSTWVGYFDEATDEIGGRKLVRFGTDLTVRWAYPYPTEEPDLPVVFDVYALNVDGETAWCHAYYSHHLLRVDDDTVTDLGPTGLTSTRAVLVRGDRGAFVGTRDGADLVMPFHLGPGGVEVGAPTARLVLPDGRECQRLRWAAHGDVLHAVTEHQQVLRVTLDELLDGPRV